MDMWVPFEVTAESVKDHDEAGREVHGLVFFLEHTVDDAGNRMKEAVEKGTVVKEEVP